VNKSMEDFMNKVGTIFLAALMAICVMVIFTGCDRATPDPNYNYRVTGHFAGWGSHFESQFMMENVARSDARIRPLRSALRNAQHIYLWEYTPNQANAAGWTVDYAGPNISLDGMYAVKFIRLIPDDFEASGWMFNMWIPSAEAGGITNLSPDTLFTPRNRSDEERDAARDGLGSNNDNPVLLRGPVSYYIVFAVMNDRSRAMGAVVK
jgi:hypothetical protein